MYTVPIDGTTRELMLIKKGRKESTFVDPADPSATPIVWEGRGGRCSNRGVAP